MSNNRARYKPYIYTQKQRHFFTNKGPHSQSYIFFISHVWMWELYHKEGWAPEPSLEGHMLLTVWITAVEHSWRYGNTRQLNLSPKKPVCRSSNSLTTGCKESTHWKRPWSWERLRAGGEGGDRGSDSWMASLTQWMGLSKLWERLKDRETCHAAIHGSQSDTT